MVAMQTQLYWRTRFRAWDMDMAKLSAGSPLLAGSGFIGISVAADQLGLTVPELLGELRASRAALYVQAPGWQGWRA